MAKFLKYKLEDKINDWTITNIDLTKKNVVYTLICKCGLEKKLPSRKLKLFKSCKYCLGAKKSDHLIGKKFGRLFVLSSERPNGIRKLKVKCDCGYEYFIKPDCLKTTRCCKNCTHGYYPGKIIEDIELIKRIKGRIWEMKCKCGKIFQSIPKYHSKYKKNFVTCGCRQLNFYLDKIKEKIGYRFGKLKVISTEKGYHHNYLICKCKCGNIIKVVNGHECKQNSCGCLLKTNNPRGEKKGNARFKNFEIMALRELYKSGLYKQKSLANMYGISTNYLSRIINNHIWKNLK